VALAVTSLGLQISAGRVDEGGPLLHYGLARRDGPLSAAAAATVAELILRLRHPDDLGRLLEGGRGVHHLVVAPAGAPGPGRGVE
jgi:hypothetical protein